MADCDAMCAVLSALFNQHKYGTPLDTEELVSRAAVEHEGDAKVALDELRSEEYPFIAVSNSRAKIRNEYYRELFDFLVLKCDRDPQELKWRHGHYEGWDRHTWWPPKD